MASFSPPLNVRGGLALVTSSSQASPEVARNEKRGEISGDGGVSIFVPNGNESKLGTGESHRHNNNVAPYHPGIRSFSVVPGFPNTMQHPPTAMSMAAARPRLTQMDLLTAAAAVSSLPVAPTAKKRLPVQQAGRRSYPTGKPIKIRKSRKQTPSERLQRR